ncbi:non-specific serine/threonine protein kinase [Planococcus antarcticus DSM 14505]|uniref:Non-specific serine/threonine protein kinase n=1 Tax=Planococcus antarcticus DSM 14505 TaxID=1185653 RepID=A0AA87LRB4_9BACL|nr:DEAD/DEAH box helicase [Planococcus antarcticus]EIM06071.1 non-specific serine/threonine protein kinase [Planococcus antarcticus DSM 14505]
MIFSINETKIKKLCGQVAYKKGRAFIQAGKIQLTPDPSDDLLIKAIVTGRSEFHVSIEQRQEGEILASCSCPPVGFVKTHCQHIAGVLLAIDDMQQRENPTMKMLDLFAQQTRGTKGSGQYFDKRKTLHVEFSCLPVLLDGTGYVFGLRIAAGTQELEPVGNISDFLKAVRTEESYSESVGCHYSPQDHRLQEENEKILNYLVKTRITGSGREEETDQLVLAVSDWEQLLPLLQAAPNVNLVDVGQITEGIRTIKELPLSFHFNENRSGGFRLDVEGLERVLVLKAYEMAVAEGALVHLTEEDTRRLAELKKLLPGSIDQLLISADEMDHFMATVVPGLERLGKVHIAEAVAERLVETPLRAKLYLDRIKHRLLAGVEFHYGHLVINPCEEPEGEFRHYPGIRRQREQEQDILRILKDSAFTQTDGGFYMQDEESEYHFLYHVTPELEELMQIYATTAVKLRVQKNYGGPKVKVEISERTDWLEFRFDLQDIPEAEIKKILTALEEKRPYYRIPNGTLMSLETAEFMDLNDFLREMDITAANFGREEIRVPLIHGLHLAASLDDGQLLDPGASFAHLLQNLSQPEELATDIPESLNGALRDYQEAGFRWLKLLAKYKFGGILADDMGLGKTLQSIAYIVSVLPDIRKQQQPVLVVAPSSLVYNWLNELVKFAPSVKTQIIDGTKTQRASLIQKTQGLDVVITSYPSLRMDQVLYRNQSFHSLFLDEAQAFKNPVTQTAKAVRKIQADHRFALTGTPIENSLDELWSIFNVVFPELLPNRRLFSEMRRDSIKKRVRPFILRRIKKDVLTELPDKVESIHFSELQKEQKKLYAAYLAELKQDAFKHLNKDSFQKNRIRILAGLTRLRQLCCHPALFVEGYEGGSAKFDQLMELIKESRLSGRRVLVFSQFTQMLGIIGHRLAKEGVPYFYLDGQTPPMERVGLCHRFNEGERDLFLISLKAGGTGLNLTGADTVVLYDLWWNPAVEQQAADRAHRMGQKKEVQVIRLVAKGTIEEKINELQMKKKNLIDDVIQSGEEPLKAMTVEDMREILTM